MPHAKKGQIDVVEQKKIIHTLAPYHRATLLGAFWGVSGPVDNPVYNPVDKSVDKPVDNLWTTSCSSVQLWITCGQPVDTLAGYLLASRPLKSDSKLIYLLKCSAVDNL